MPDQDSTTPRLLLKPAEAARNGESKQYVPPTPFVKLPKNLLARQDLTATTKVVYGAIVDRMGANGLAWPGLRRIAADVGINVKTAGHAVRQIQAAGLLEVEARGNGRVNHYRIPAECDRAISTVGRTGAPPKVERPKNATGGVDNPGTAAHRLCPHNETYPGKQTQKSARSTIRRRKIDPSHSELTAYFAEEWRARHDHKYPHAGGKDGVAVTAILRAVEGDLQRAKRIVTEFLDDPDPWLRGKHTLAMLSAQLTRYLEKPNARKNTRGQTAWPRERHVGQETSRGSAARASVDRGEYPESDAPLPRFGP